MTHGFSNNSPPVHLPPLVTDVTDTVGAGDAFFSVAGLAAASRLPIEISTFLGQLAGAQAVNIVGNVASGRALQRGVPAQRLLLLGFVAMAASAVLAFAQGPAPAGLRYGAVLVFSAVGGLIPGTLFSLAVRVAPHERCMATTVGWMQQWSSAGQFAGPPAVAWLASQMGGWHWTWAATGLCSLLGVLMALVLQRRLRATSGRPPEPHT
jgi:hypothetical protein